MKNKRKINLPERQMDEPALQFSLRSLVPEKVQK